MNSYLVETAKFTSRVDVSEGIVIYTDPSLKWALGKMEDRLWAWMNKTFPNEWKKHKQETM